MATKKRVKAKAKTETFDVDQMAMLVVTVNKDGGQEHVRVIISGIGPLAGHLRRVVEQWQQDPAFNWSSCPSCRGG